MKVVHSKNGFHTLSFAKEEHVIAGLSDFFQKQNIQAGHITGLGAASEVTVAYYNLQKKAYETKRFVEDVEILSLIGNVGRKEDEKAVVHLHGTFGRSDFSVFGGHIVEMIISGAGEIQVTSLEGTINRAYDEETGLTLMCDSAPNGE